MRDAVVVGGSDATIRWTLWRLLVGVRRACEAARRVLTRRARRHSLKMVSLKTAFMVHGVVGFLFCLPIAFGGLKGFLSMMAEPEVVTWDKCVRCPCRALPRAT